MSPKYRNKKSGIRKRISDYSAEKGDSSGPELRHRIVKSGGNEMPLTPGKTIIFNGRQFLGLIWWQVGILLITTCMFFLLYLKTAARFLPPGDSGELIAAAWNFGVAHPPGYPTFTILGHLASLFPIGTPALRLNLLSGILDSFALGVLGFGMLRFLRAKIGKFNDKFDQLAMVPGVVLGIGFLAVSTVFWSYSIVAEVFALNNLLATIVLVLML